MSTFHHHQQQPIYACPLQRLLPRTPNFQQAPERERLWSVSLKDVLNVYRKPVKFNKTTKTFSVARSKYRGIASSAVKITYGTA